MMIYKLHLSPPVICKETGNHTIEARAYYEEGSQIFCRESGRLVVPKRADMRPCPPTSPPPSHILPVIHTIVYTLIKKSILESKIPSKVDKLVANPIVMNIPVGIPKRIRSPVTVSVPAAVPAAVPATVPATVLATVTAPVPAQPAALVKAPVSAQPAALVPATVPVPAKTDTLSLRLNSNVYDPAHTHLECTGNCKKHPLMTPTLYRMMQGYSWGGMLYDEEMKLKNKARVV